jgi:hypothetical protein
MQHAVLRVGFYGNGQGGYSESSLPVNLKNYICERYRQEHSDEDINARAPPYGPLVQCWENVPIHTMLDWIGAAGWTLSNMCGSVTPNTERWETYIFTRRLE